MEKYKCKICNKEFNSKQALGGHVSSHSPKKKKNCEKCGRLIIVSRYKSHYDSCDGNPIPKKERRKLNGKTAWNKGLTKETDIRVKKGSETIKKRYKEGKLKGSFLGKKHTIEAKKKISDAALKSKHRRLVKSCRLYKQKNGKEVLLDSSWEESLAKRLDELNITWERPINPIPYKINNIKHNYFPDFYLPEYDIFLDPKNPYAVIVQKEKINLILQILPNLIILESLKECKNFNI